MDWGGDLDPGGTARRSFRWSFHQVLLGVTRAQLLDSAPNLTCKDSTGHHAADRWEATHNRSVAGSRLASLTKQGKYVGIDGEPVGLLHLGPTMERSVGSGASSLAPRSASHSASDSSPTRLGSRIHGTSTSDSAGALRNTRLFTR
jgi:hypothetical protein